MAYRQLVAQVRSQCPAAVSPRVFLYIGSWELKWNSTKSKIPVACRTYSTSTVETPQQHLATSPEFVKSKQLSTPTPESPRPAKANPSSAQTLISPNPRTKKSQKQKPTPVVVVYHNPESAGSVKLLTLLRRAQNSFPQTRKRTGPPLEFDLRILERLPTVEELQDLYSLLNESSWTIFRTGNAASNYRRHPTSARSLLDLIDLERQEEIAKAKQLTHDNTVTVAPPTDISPLTTSSADMLTANENELTVLDIDHPLFGTKSFPWPVMACWDAKKVFLGLRFKNVDRLLKNFANDRDDIKSEEEIKSEAEKARQANWTYPEKEVSPDEDDTLKWFNESGRKGVKQPFF